MSSPLLHVVEVGLLFDSRCEVSVGDFLAQNCSDRSGHNGAASFPTVPRRLLEMQEPGRRHTWVFLAIPLPKIVHPVISTHLYALSWSEVYVFVWGPLMISSVPSSSVPQFLT